MSIVIDDSVLVHYGIKRRSGRYPWGSGDKNFQRSGDFLSRVQELKKSGMSEPEIVSALGLDSSTQLRVAYTVAKNERRKLMVATAKSMSEDGFTPTQIGVKMNLNESSVRSLLSDEAASRMNQAEHIKGVLEKELATKGVLDVGAGVERELGVSRQKLEEALFMMEAEGTGIRDGIGVPTGPHKQTNVMVIRKPDIEVGAIYSDRSMIKPVGEYHSTDGGQTFDKREYPASIDSNRVQIRYGDQGGLAKDGVIELRRGVADLDLGPSHYAQVRIMVDGTHYLKGMAMYSDDMPDGVDVVFNTNKTSDTPKLKVLKEIKPDPDNPFGAYIKADGQSYYPDPKGKYVDPVTGERRSLSAINKLKEEGDWDKMSKTLSSQFLSKQPMKLINKQLAETYKGYEDTYAEIASLTNPTVKRKLLLEFADNCDSASIQLKAAALPRQETRVILPLTTIKPNEIYAPYLENGEKVALVRFPHGGTFEIPVLTVNNKNKAARSLLGNVKDAVGIHSDAANQLSGADFDGDTAVVIPMTNGTKITARKPLEGLKDFDPKVEYSTEGKTGVRIMTKAQTQREMGMISNLITDMTLQGASDSEITKAVRHSMVVIDAAKHKLDYKKSEIDNDIATLKTRYQPKYDDVGNVIGGGGATTLLSRRKQTAEVPERRGSGRIDPETGKVSYKQTGRKYKDADGNWVLAKTKVSIFDTVDDAHAFSSGTAQEDAYADYINRMRSLSAKARKEYVNTPKLEYSSSANKSYKEEVESLKALLGIAEMNAPRERQARVIADSVVKAKTQAYPELNDKANRKELNKIKQTALYDARNSVGASGKGTRINITDKQWEAIQAGAVSDNMLSKILRYTDPDAIRARALPRSATQLSPAQVSKIHAMSNSGRYTISQIANALGISPSSVSEYIK